MNSILPRCLCTSGLVPQLSLLYKYQSTFNLSLPLSPSLSIFWSTLFLFFISFASSTSIFPSSHFSPPSSSYFFFPPPPPPSISLSFSNVSFSKVDMPLNKETKRNQFFFFFRPFSLVLNLIPFCFSLFSLFCFNSLLSILLLWYHIALSFKSPRDS